MYKKIVITLLLILLSIDSSAQEGIYNFLTGKTSVDYNKLFKEVLEKVKKNYVEEVTDQKLMENAIQGMVSSLDPHSDFLNEKDYQEMSIAIEGEFGGIGVEVVMDKGILKVVSPYEDSPAFKAGLKAGDYITKIDDQSIRGFSSLEVIEKLRGKPKTRVKVTVEREGVPGVIDVIIIRDIIRLASVKAKLVSDDVILLRISSFNKNTPTLLKKEFFKLVEEAKENNIQIKGIILDVRTNPGGLLYEAIEVTELFIENGIIVTTKGRVPDANKVYKASGFDITEGLPIVVLINAGSASAAEIVAGALQDNKRALLVGTKTFGKGVVQMIIPLTGGNTALKLTTSKYYTPSGRSIQGRGIEPDVLVEEAFGTHVKAREQQTSESSLVRDAEPKNESKTKDKKQLASSSNNEKVDFQLIRAIDLVKGMALYSERLVN